MASAQQPAVPRRPLLARRVGGAIVDVVLVGLAAGYISDLGPALGLFTAGGGAETLVLNAGMLFYFVPLWWTGGTLGHRLLGTRVVGPDGSRPSLGRALARYVAAYLALMPLGIGLLWAAVDPRGQGWHDRVAGTFVVRASRGPGATVPAPALVPASRSVDRAAIAVVAGFILAFWSWLPLLVLVDGIAASPVSMEDGLGWSVLAPGAAWLVFAVANRGRGARRVAGRVLVWLGVLFLVCSLLSGGLALTGYARRGSIAEQVASMPVLLLVVGSVAVWGLICLATGWWVMRMGAGAPQAR